MTAFFYFAFFPMHSEHRVLKFVVSINFIFELSLQIHGIGLYLENILRKIKA